MISNYDRFGAKRKSSSSADHQPTSSKDDESKNGNASTAVVDDMGLYPPPQTSRPLSSQQLSLVRSLPRNDVCVECENPNPDWASVTYGIVLCLNCAGIHRGLGVHLSFVRSLTMDDWTDDQYIRMVQGGNAKWREYWEMHGTSNDAGLLSFGESEQNMDKLRRKIRLEYESNTARAYREALSLDTKSCRSRNTPADLVSASTEGTTPAPSPTPFGVQVLEEDVLPCFQDVLKKQAWPFVLSLMKSRKSKLMIMAWGILGLTGAYGAHWRGCNIASANMNITSSLPTVNPVAQGYMGASSTSGESDSYYNLIALGVLALTAGIPYFLIRNFANKIAQSLLINRQDAFKSARNLLMDRIALGRAQRLKRCDVYYPTTSDDGHLRAKCGLILYPGALVDRTAYAPIATRLSEAGVLVAVANLEPYRLVSRLEDYPLKEEVMHILSDTVLLGNQGTWTVDEWAIGGHSMGGHLAIAAVANELSSTVKKVVLWGVGTRPDPNTYPCKRTLREIGDVDVLLMNGSNDEIIGNIVSDAENERKRFEASLPPISRPGFAEAAGHTHYAIIEGGNHSGCAHYGPQTYPHADGLRTITLEQQQRRMAEITFDFLLESRSKRD